MSAHRLPATFRSLFTLRVLNVLALATSIAAATGMVFGFVFGSGNGNAMAPTALSTFVVGLAWALAMRWRKKVPKLNVRVGWLASIPLAAANGGAACALLVGVDSPNRFLSGFALGATIGGVFWIPGLVTVLALYGLPIAKAQALADKGLAGEEQGERFVGLVSSLLAVLAFVMTLAAGPTGPSPDMLATIGRPVVFAFSAAGALSGLAAVLLASYRDRVRRQFVRDVETGAVQGFRVDATSEGKVLVRITSQGGGYRAATFEEDVYGLDETGGARRELSTPRY